MGAGVDDKPSEESGVAKWTVTPPMGYREPSILSAALAGVDDKASQDSGVAKWTVTPPMGCRDPSIVSAALIGADVDGKAREWRCKVDRHGDDWMPRALRPFSGINGSFVYDKASQESDVANWTVVCRWDAVRRKAKWSSCKMECREAQSQIAWVHELLSFVSLIFPRPISRLIFPSIFSGALKALSSS